MGKYEQAHAKLRAAQQTAPEEVAARPSVRTLARDLATLAPPSIRRDAEQFRQPDRRHPVTTGAASWPSSSAAPDLRPRSAPRRAGPGPRLDVQVIATPAALDFFDPAAIEEQTGSPVRSQYARPGAPRSLIPDAILVAPATYNTINKWAHGISDTYALGVLAETTGLGVPAIVLPFVNTALAAAPRSAAASNPCAPKA